MGGQEALFNQGDRQHIGDGCRNESFVNHTAHQKTATPLSNKFFNHLQLVGVKETFFDITQYQRFILIEFFPGTGKPAAQFSRRLYALTIVFLRSCLQVSCQTKRWIIFNGSTNKLVFIARMSLNIKNIKWLLFRVIYEKTIFIVLLYNLTALQLNLKLIHDGFLSFRRDL